MKIVVTGSLGNISLPLTKELVQKGHTVTVISSNANKQADIEALGATAAIGTLKDVPFLTATFTGADAVYCMVPPDFTAPDLDEYYTSIGENYAQAILASNVKRVVYLSSYGADLDKGTGVILGAHYVEQILDKLPGITLTHMRPAYSNYNLFSFIPVIKAAGIIAVNYDSEGEIVLVSPIDIAAAIADEIVLPATRHKIRYVAGDIQRASDIARVLGTAIGKPDLKWLTITDEQMLNGLTSNGVPASLAAKLVELYACLNSGKLTKDYYLHPPAELGKVKLADFVNEFAAAFNRNN